MFLDENFPIHNVNFVGNKDSSGFSQVYSDFNNAKEIRILTYSNIQSGVLNKLRNITGDVDIKIIVAPAGLRAKEENGYKTYDANSIKSKLSELKELFKISEFKADKVSLYFCFKNHAKLVGTENILYVGSANYSNASRFNYEAGVLVRDKDDIRRIYESFYDRIVTVEIQDNEFDAVKIRFLQLHDMLEEMNRAISELSYEREDRYTFFATIRKILSEALEECTSLSEYLKSYNFQNPSNVGYFIEKIEQIYSAVDEDIREQISNLSECEFDMTEEGLAEFFEDEHKSRFNVYTDDAWITPEQRYVPLVEDCDMGEYIDEYWFDYVENHHDLVELKKTVNELSNLVEDITKAEYDYGPEIIRQGTDPNVDK